MLRQQNANSKLLGESNFDQKAECVAESHTLSNACAVGLVQLQQSPVTPELSQNLFDLAQRSLSLVPAKRSVCWVIFDPILTLDCVLQLYAMRIPFCVVQLSNGQIGLKEKATMQTLCSEVLQLGSFVSEIHGTSRPSQR
jgi:hypothetical protein